MKCNNCGYEHNGRYCPMCGTQAEKSTLKPDVKNILIDKTEKIYAILGNNYLQTFIATNIIGEGFAVLTDKRIYFKGKSFRLIGNKLHRKLEEQTVDLKDVSGTGFSHRKAVWAKVCGFLAIALSVLFTLILMIMGDSLPYESEMLQIFVYLLTLCSIPTFFIIYKLSFITLFIVSYAGGRIAFDMRLITEQEAKYFQQQLVVLKNSNQNESINNSNVNVNPNPNVEQNTVLLLNQYKTLLDNGVISQEEFDAKKKQLIGL